jgi:hypothetical protein
MVQCVFVGNAGCFKKSFTMVFQMLLCGECCEKAYKLSIVQGNGPGVKRQGPVADLSPPTSAEVNKTWI